MVRGSFTLAFILLTLFCLTAVILSLFLKEPDAKLCESAGQTPVLHMQ